MFRYEGTHDNVEETGTTPTEGHNKFGDYEIGDESSLDIEADTTD